MKVVLALDLSPFSEIVVCETLNRLWPQGSTFHILHVIDLFALTFSGGQGERFIEKETERAETLLKSVRERFQAHGLEAVTTVIEGYPGTAIVDHAKQAGADFVIVGSHGQGWVARFLLGSVAGSVVRNAHCSVEIVRQISRKRATGGKRILLATDGSEYSMAAAHSIADRPWPTGSEVKIISVIDIVMPAIEPWYVDSQVMDMLRKARTDEAQEANGTAERLIKAAGIRTSTVMPIGPSRGIILDEAGAWEADLLVAGSHGRRGMTRLLLGSVSEALALHAPCSVDVIREPLPLSKEST